MSNRVKLLGCLSAAVMAFFCVTSALAEDKFVAVEPYYGVKNEVGIYGVVTKRTGTKVVFQPCAGKAKEIDDSELEVTLNTCDDGNGGAFASICDQTVNASQAAKTNFDAIGKKFEIGTVFETKNGDLTPTDLAAIDAGKTVVKLKSCNRYWSVGTDAKGDVILQMLSVDPSKLSNSKTLEWQ